MQIIFISGAKIQNIFLMVVALQPFLLISHKKRSISIRNQPYFDNIGETVPS